MVSLSQCSTQTTVLSKHNACDSTSNTSAFVTKWCNAVCAMSILSAHFSLALMYCHKRLNILSNDISTSHLTKINPQIHQRSPWMVNICHACHNDPSVCYNGTCCCTHSTQDSIGKNFLTTDCSYYTNQTDYTDSPTTFSTRWTNRRTIAICSSVCLSVHPWRACIVTIRCILVRI